MKAGMTRTVPLLGVLIPCFGYEGLAVRAAEKSDERKPEEARMETVRKEQVLAFDDFVEVLSLDWEILHKDPTHYSLARNPGTLTITAQDGQFSSANADYENQFLIDAPSAGTEFQITTCIAGFKPEVNFHQAGLVFWNDEDNYLKWVYAKNDYGHTFTVIGETNGRARVVRDFRTHGELARVWLRVGKRGNSYQLATGLDGKSFQEHATVSWADGSVKTVGLFANTGSGTGAPEIDAAFEFFEVKTLTAGHDQAVGRIPDRTSDRSEPKRSADKAVEKPVVVEPKAKTALWTGEDLSQWTFAPIDKDIDPKSVWSIKDGVVRCKGEPLGYMRTKTGYRDYRMHIEWRWIDKPGDSGVLLNAQGPYVCTKAQPFPKSIEAQLKPGNAGDVVALYGASAKGKQDFDPGNPFPVVRKRRPGNEKPVGEWNTYDIAVVDSAVIFFVNDVAQNMVETRPHEGSICLVSEGGEIEFRNAYVAPLTQTYFASIERDLRGLMDAKGGDATGAFITGRVTDADGKPIAGAYVLARAWGPGHDIKEAVSGEDGRFRLENVKPRQEYRVFVEADGYAAAYITRRTNAGETAGFDYRLGTAAHISARVVDTEGRPQPGLALELVPTVWNRDRIRDKNAPGILPLGLAFQPIADEEGRFETSNAAPGRYWVKVYQPDPGADRHWQQMALDQPLVVKAGERLEDLKIRIHPPDAHVISGVLVDGQGKPRSGVTADTYIPHGRHWWVRTDEQGRFVLKSLNGIGRNSLDMSVGGYTLRNVPIGTKDVRIVMHEPGEIAGIVLDEGGEKPLADYELKVNRVHLPDSAAIAFKPKAKVIHGEMPGTFHITAVPPGKAILEIKVGARKQWSEVEVRTGEVTNDVKITLQPPCVLEGHITVTDPRGPVRKARLGLTHLGTGQGTVWFDTDENGRYRIDTLPAGAYAVRAVHVRRGTWNSIKNVRLEQGKTVKKQFHVGGTATIRGTVRFPDQDYGGAQIRLREAGLGVAPNIWGDEPPTSERVLTTAYVKDSGSEYTIQLVPAGTWEVVAFASATESCIAYDQRPHVSHVVTIKDGETKELDLTLTVAGE